MSAEPTGSAPPSADRLVATGVRRLTPATTTVFEGTFSLLHCAVKGDDLYRGVFAVRMFPVRHPDRYISLHYTDAEDKEREIGMIEDLSVFPEEQRRLVMKSLQEHYYEQVIVRIHRVRYEFGLLFFEVESVVELRRFQADDFKLRATFRADDGIAEVNCWF